MAAGAAWVDEICQALELRSSRRGCRGRSVNGATRWATPRTARARRGLYLIGWGASDAEIEVIYVGETGRARARLARLEDQVKWGLEHGFNALRDVLEQRDDHRTMKNVWLKMIRVDEIPLYKSAALTPERLNAIGSRRRQLAMVLLAEHFARFGERVAGNQDTARLFLRSAGRGRGGTRPRAHQEAA